MVVLCSSHLWCNATLFSCSILGMCSQKCWQRSSKRRPTCSAHSSIEDLRKSSPSEWQQKSSLTWRGCTPPGPSVIFTLLLPSGHWLLSCYSLPERRHSRVRTWTRHVDIFSKDFIIVPINERFVLIFHVEKAVSMRLTLQSFHHQCPLVSCYHLLPLAEESCCGIKECNQERGDSGEHTQSSRQFCARLIGFITESWWCAFLTSFFSSSFFSYHRLNQQPKLQPKIKRKSQLPLSLLQRNQPYQLLKLHPSQHNHDLKKQTQYLTHTLPNSELVL